MCFRGLSLKNVSCLQWYAIDFEVDGQLSTCSNKIQIVAEVPVQVI